MQSNLPNLAADAVLLNSEELPDDTPHVRGYDFNNGIDFVEFFKSLKCTGFQATNFGLAVEQINAMLKWKLSDDPISEQDMDHEKDTIYRQNVKCTIFLGYTSNMISCGVRESIRYIVQHNMVDAIVTTGGGIEEDLMKCMNPHLMGDFELRGHDLRRKGLNRIGNLLVPNKNYCSFETWLTPILDEMVEKQKEGVKWSPSTMIDLLGERINHEDSVLYWAHKNKIPIFCPAITDGSVGDMIFFHSYRNPGLVLDIVEDIISLNQMAMKAKKSGMIILGGGVVKHHICNANLMRNGADFSLFVNTGNDFDGSDSGAKPDEAISWGKIRLDASPVKLHGDASLLFPLLVSQTFAPFHQSRIK